MKAEERHRLKHNALADALGDMPSFIKEQGPRVGVIILVFVILISGWSIGKGLLQSKERERFDELVSVIGLTRSYQLAAAQASQSGELPETDEISQNALSLSGQLDGLADVDKGVRRMALLEKAKVLRSQLAFTTQQTEAQQDEAILSDLKGIYQQLADENPDSPMIQGLAQMGLGVIAEDRGEMEQARLIYEQVVGQAEKYEGTLYPLQARVRLSQMEQWSAPISFGQATEPVEVEEPAVDSIPQDALVREILPDLFADQQQ